MSQPVSKKKIRRSEPMLPEEQFWKCYSPNFEFPLAFAGAIALHGLALGVVIILGFQIWKHNVAAGEPPRMDVVEIKGELEGGGGTGGAGGPGAGPTVPGPLAKLQNPSLKELLKANANDSKLDVPKNPDDLKIPDKSNKPEAKADEADAAFAAVLAERQEELAQAMKVSVQQVRSFGMLGGSPGSGGGLGGGHGGGIGNKTGPSSGTKSSGSVGNKHQDRWNIDFSEDSAEHVKKLKRLRVIVAVPSKTKGLFSLLDLSGPGAKYSASFGLEKFAHNIGYAIHHAETVAKIAKELHLPTIPDYLVIFLSESMENELAQLEYQHALSKGIQENQIEKTFFAIIQRPDGTYGPMVVGQAVKQK